MSHEARERAATLFQHRNDPDFQTQLANALISYGNFRLDHAARQWDAVHNPAYDDKGAKNLAALVADLTAQITEDYEAVLERMQEQSVK